MNKYAEDLSRELEEYGEVLQDLACELEDGEVDPMRIVSMQIYGEQHYQKIEKLMHSYLLVEDGEEE